MKVNVLITPQEFREKILGDTKTGKIYDKLLQSFMEVSGFTEAEAQAILAPLFFDSLKKLIKDGS